MVAGLVDILGPQRHYFLFDSFEGLPAAKAIDGPAALAWQSRTDSPEYWDNCSAERDFAERAMRMSGAKQFTLVKGWFEQTLPEFTWDSSISFLHRDADLYDSTMTRLNWLFDRVTPG
ncbi:MAG: TylF/MycF/NovP-related O-methyltransferase, partial [Bradyrhizobium sp.]